MNAGKIPIGGLIFLALLATGVWAGWQLARPWLSYFQFRDEVRELVKVAPAIGPGHFKSRIYEVTQESNAWIEDPQQEVRVVYANNRVKVAANWTAYVFFPFDIQYSFDFSVDEERVVE